MERFGSRSKVVPDFGEPWSKRSLGRPVRDWMARGAPLILGAGLIFLLEGLEVMPVEAVARVSGLERQAVATLSAPSALGGSLAQVPALSR